MNDLKATILLEDVYVDDYHDLLEIINNKKTTKKKANPYFKFF